MARVLSLQIICKKTDQSVEAAVQAIFDPTNKDMLITAYPLTSSILAHIVVLPASSTSSTQVEHLFSIVKMIKTVERNCLATETLDCLIRFSSEGPPVQHWNPIPALRKWESWKKEKLQQPDHQLVVKPQLNNNLFC